MCGYKYFGILVAIMVTAPQLHLPPLPCSSSPSLPLCQSCISAAFGYLQQPIVSAAINSGSFATMTAGLLASQCVLLLAYLVFKRQNAAAVDK